MLSFPVLMLWHKCADSHPKNGFIRDTLTAKKPGHNSLKNALLKLSFQHDGHLYANCLIHILTIYWKYLLFQFLDYGIPGYGYTFPSLQGLKKCGHLYANCLIYIYCEFFYFHFFSRGHMYANLHHSSRSKCTRKSPKKKSYFAKKCCF